MSSPSASRQGLSRPPCSRFLLVELTREAKSDEYESENLGADAAAGGAV